MRAACARRLQRPRRQRPWPGPGIRSHHFAVELARDFDVTLVVPFETDLVERPRSRSCTTTLGTRLGCPRSSAATTSSSRSTSRCRRCARSRACPPASIYDLYAPLTLEQLALRRAGGPAIATASAMAQLNNLTQEVALATGDAFVCASEKQRDFWLGALASVGRIDRAQLRARPVAAHAHRRRPLRHRPGAAGAGPGVARRRARNRRGRPDPALAGRDLELVRPAHGDPRGPRALAPARRRPAVLPGPEAPESGYAGAWRWRARRSPSRTSSSCAIASSSSTSAGFRTPSAAATCSRRTLRSRRTSTTSRRGSRSAPDSSTASGPACPSSRRAATRSATRSSPAVAAAPSTFGDVDGWVDALETLLDDAPAQRARASAAAALRPSLEWPLVRRAASPPRRAGDDTSRAGTASVVPPTLEYLSLRLRIGYARHGRPGTLRRLLARASGAARARSVAPALGYPRPPWRRLLRARSARARAFTAACGTTSGSCT